MFCHSLQVSHNRLCHLPEQICAMTSLREINASHNVITGIPSELGSLTKLQLLLLDHNKLTALPDTVGGLWRTLTELTLNHNRLTVLPNSLGACKKITILDLGAPSECVLLAPMFCPSCPWCLLHVKSVGADGNLLQRLLRGLLLVQQLAH